MNKNKYTRADIAKTITDAGVERTNAAAIALTIVKSMADALTAGKVIELRGREHWNPGNGKPAQCTIPDYGSG